MARGWRSRRGFSRGRRSPNGSSRSRRRGGRRWRGRLRVTGWDLETIGACAGAIGDLGEAISLLVKAPEGEGLTILDVDQTLRELAKQRKAAEKQKTIEGLLSRATPAEAKYLVKTLSGGLRTGADFLTVEEAIAKAFGADREEVGRARRDCGDIGETAVAAKQGRLKGITFRLFHPIGFMLATPIEDPTKSRRSCRSSRSRKSSTGFARTPTSRGREWRSSPAPWTTSRRVSRDHDVARARARRVPPRWRDRRVEGREAGLLLPPPEADGEKGAARRDPEGHSGRLHRVRLPRAKRRPALRISVERAAAAPRGDRGDAGSECTCRRSRGPRTPASSRRSSRRRARRETKG